MKYTHLKRLLALILAFAMIMSLGITGAYAAQDEESGKLSYEKLDSISTSLANKDNQIETDTAELYGDDELVRVTIVLDGEAAIDQASAAGLYGDTNALAELGEYIQSVQNRIVSSISDEALGGDELDVVWNFTTVINAISANVYYGDIDAIENVEGVKEVVLENRYIPMDTVADKTNIVAQQMTGANTAQSNGYTGAGSRIAVIDTGVDTDHQSFAEDAFLYSLSKVNTDYELMDKDDISAVISRLHAYEAAGSLSADDVYINSKIPFGFNYIDQNTNVTHDRDTQGSHGSHVAGIAAANRYVSIDRVYDFDGDRDFDIDDAQALMDHVILGTDVENISHADINGDGVVSDRDVQIFIDMLEESDTYLNAAEAVGVSGVAPDAQLIAMKVFGESGGAYESDYIAAIEDAVMLGCDTVNLSLGVPYGGMSNSYTYLFYDQVFDSLENYNVVVCISAGNSYNWADYDEAYQMMYADEGGTSTVGTPGTYTNALAVASAENIGKISILKTTLSGKGEKNDITLSENVYYGLNEAWTTLDPECVGIDYEIVFLGDPSNLINGKTQTDTRIYGGDISDFDDYDFSGKIVLIARGNEVYWITKHMNAELADAAGLIIYNNIPATEDGGGNIAISIEGSTATIPCTVFSLEEAAAVYDMCSRNSSGMYTATLRVKCGVDIDWGDANGAIEMSDFSSWGTTGNLSIKPEITAPGGEIFSVNGVDTTGTAYETMSGTSMAAPHIAGISALASQYIRTSGLDTRTGIGARKLIQSLMMSTAEPITEEATGYEYSVRNQGAGLANISNIISAQSYVMVKGQDDGKVKAELGDGTAPYSFTFTINNFSGNTKTYDLSASILTTGSASIDGYQFATSGMTRLDANVSFSTGSSVTVAAGSSADVTVTIAISEATANAMKAKGFTNGFYVEGYVYAQAQADAEGNIDVTHSIPLLGWYGNWSDPSMYDIGTYTDYVYDTLERPAHVNASYKNFIAWCDSSDINYPYLYNGNIYSQMLDGQIYEDEDGKLYGDSSYNEARNAINVTSDRSMEIYGIFPSLIRTATDFDLYVTREDTGEVIYRENYEGNVLFGNFFYVNSGAWYDMTTDNGIAFNSFEFAKNIPEGTRLTITLAAVPEYYVNNHDKYMNSFEYSDEYNADLFAGYELDDAKWTDGTIGEGAFLSFGFTVDNTAPDLDATAENPLSLDGKTLSYTVRDNEYIAAITLLDSTGTYGLDYNYPDMATEDKGKAVSGSIDLSGFEEDWGDRYILAICDYAGNETYYAININGLGESFGDLVAFQFGDGYHADTYAWASFSEGVNKDEYILFKEENNFVAAEYINGYVFAQDSAGRLYGIEYEDMVTGALRDLDSTYITTLDRVYQDFAYNYKNGELYGLYTNEYNGYPTSYIYMIDIDGDYDHDANEAVSLGSVYGFGLAIDDDGYAYILGQEYEYDWGEQTGVYNENGVLWKSENEEWTNWGSFDKLGDTGITMDYRQSMTWDHNSEALYWAQFNANATGTSTWQFLYKIDPDNAKCEKVGTLRTETYAMFAPLSDESAAKTEHANVPAFDVSEAGKPILSMSNITLSVGGKYTLSCSFDPWYSEKTDVVWTSSDKDVATVKDGVVTATGEGTCTITVKSKDDPSKFDTCQVGVANLSVEINGIVSQLTGTTGEASNSHIYGFKLDKGDTTMTHGKKISAKTISDEQNMSMSTLIYASVEADGYVWASEEGNGLIYKIDGESGEVKDWFQPIGGGHSYGMTYSEKTGLFATIMNNEIVFDIPMTHESENERFKRNEDGSFIKDEDGNLTADLDWHKVQMKDYLIYSNKSTNFVTGENGYGAETDIVFCGITTIDEQYSFEPNYMSFMGEYDWDITTLGIEYTSDVTYVLLDNVGRLWYIDRAFTGLNVYEDDFGNVAYWSGESFEDAVYYGNGICVMGGEYGTYGILPVIDTDDNGNQTATLYYIRSVEETTLTDMYRNGTMPRITYSFSDICYLGKTDDGAPMFAMSLYDYWNNGRTNQFYLYVGCYGTGEMDPETWTEIMSDDALYNLGDAGDTYAIASISSAKYIGGLPASGNDEGGTAAQMAIRSGCFDYVAAMAAAGSN